MFISGNIVQQAVAFSCYSLYRANGLFPCRTFVLPKAKKHQRFGTALQTLLYPGTNALITLHPLHAVASAIINF